MRFARPMIGPSTLWGLSARLHQRGARRSARSVKLLNYVLFRTVLPPEAAMSDVPELMHHGLAVVIHPTTVFGSRVHIGHGVTIAASPMTHDGSVQPVIVGDDVSIGAGAILVARRTAPLRIGSGAVIGAGSVVVHDVQPGERVAGNPARSVRRVGAVDA